MFYKKIDENWEVAKSVKTPKGELKKGEIGGGWEWNDDPPKEFLEWKEEQEDDK